MILADYKYWDSTSVQMDLDIPESASDYVKTTEEEIRLILIPPFYPTLIFRTFTEFF